MTGANLERMSSVVKLMIIFFIVFLISNNIPFVNGDEDASVEDLKKLKAMYVAVATGGKKLDEEGCEDYNDDVISLASKIADVSSEELKEKDGFKKKGDVHDKINKLKELNVNWCGFSESLECKEAWSNTGNGWIGRRVKKCLQCNSRYAGACDNINKIVNAKDWKPKPDPVAVITLIKISGTRSNNADTGTVLSILIWSLLNLAFLR